LNIHEMKQTAQGVLDWHSDIGTCTIGVNVHKATKLCFRLIFSFLRLI